MEGAKKEITNCGTCPKRSKCKQRGDPYGMEHGGNLCKWINKYICQDYVYRRENPQSPKPKGQGKNIPLDNLNFYVSSYIPPESISDFFEEGERLNFPFLSKRENDVLTAAEINKMTAKQIALKFKVKTRTVETKLYRAKKKIEDYFFNSPEGKKRLEELTNKGEMETLGEFAEKVFYAKRAKRQNNMDDKNYGADDGEYERYSSPGKEAPVSKLFDDYGKLMEDDFDQY